YYCSISIAVVVSCLWTSSGRKTNCLRDRSISNKWCVRPENQQICLKSVFGYMTEKCLKYLCRLQLEPGSIFVVNRFTEETFFREEDSSFSLPDDQEILIVEGQWILQQSTTIPTTAPRPLMPIPFPRLPGTPHIPTPPPIIARQATPTKTCVLRFCRGNFNGEGQLVDIDRR
uniref:Uncharacterized protein n=1 Tax=Romanomermis culicivorax TaxID=13658 RepID=A0A915KF23_ROMCU